MFFSRRRRAKAQTTTIPSFRPALEQLEDRVVLSSSIPLNPNTWVDIGPAPINQGNLGLGFGAVSGRVAGIATDPTNANVIYIAAAGGGVWKTTDGGTTWSPLTDHLTDNSGNPIVEFMGAIALGRDSSGNQVLYAGTGEANNSLDSNYGEGILVSTDGGATWKLTGQIAFNGMSIAQIAVDPQNPNVAYAAVSFPGNNANPAGVTGIYKTLNRGASWTNVTLANGQDSTDNYSSVVIDPTTTGNTAVLFAAIGNPKGAKGNGVIESTDGGTTWKAVSGVTGGTTAGRDSLAISHPASQSQATLYASVASPTTGGLLELDQSIDTGASWIKLTKAPDYLGATNSGGGQGWYDNVVVADPLHPNTVFAAGVVTYATGKNLIVESTDGGKTWTDLTVGTAGNNGPHTDMHALAFNANDALIAGSDGGVWTLTSNDVVTPNIRWTDSNGNLETIQFTGVALDPTDPNRAYGGSQDNGAAAFNDSRVWNLINGGDGGFLRVDPVTPSTFYVTGSIDNVPFVQRFDNFGASITDISAGITDLSNAVFYPPFQIDPNNHLRLLLGTDLVNETLNRGASWTTLPALPTTADKAPITALSMVPGNAIRIYVSSYDTKTKAPAPFAHLFYTSNNGNSWNDITPPGIDGTAQIKSIFVDPRDATGNTVYVTVNNRTGGGHVWMTTNGTSAVPSWTDITGDLPDSPANTIVLTQNPNQIVVGTDIGAYVSTQANGNATQWTRYGGNSLPNAQVAELVYDPNTQILGAGTHGRSMFEIQVAPTVGTVGVTAPVNPKEGISTGSFTVATFTTNESNPVPANFSATISWGDGTTSTVSGSPNIVKTGASTFAVVASHAYSEEATNLTLSVTVNDLTTGTASSGSATVAAVTDAPLTSTGNNVTVTEGQAASGVALATFTDTDTTNTDRDPASNPADYTATINWSDGHGNTGTSSGTIVYAGTGRTFNVLGTSPFLFPEEGGPITATITIADVGGATTTATSAITVADSPLTGTGTTLNAAEGDTLATVTVATFTDTDATNTATDPFGVIGDYTAQITFQTPSGPQTATGTIVSTGGNTFAVTANLATTFTEEGTYPATIAITDVGGAALTINSNVQISDAPIQATPKPITTVVPEGGVPGYQQVALFTDTDQTNTMSDPQGVIGDYTAMVTWDDGGSTHTTSGTIVSLGGNLFAVYALDAVPVAEDGVHTVSVSIADVGGATASVVTSFTATQGAFSATGTTFTANEGLAYNGTIGTLFDPEPVPTAFNQNNNAVNIDWGDGQTSNGTVVPIGNGSFNVLGNHTYKEEGSYAVNFRVIDSGGNTTATAVTSAAVIDSPITQFLVVPPPAIAITQGMFNFPIATFVDQNIYATAADFSTTISFADDTSSVGLVVPLGNGLFTVLVTHPAISSAGPVTVTVRDDGGAAAQGSSVLSVGFPTFVANTLQPSPFPGLGNGYVTPEQVIGNIDLNTLQAELFGLLFGNTGPQAQFFFFLAQASLAGLI